MIIESCAYARAGLLGNPSDGYFGKTISISVMNFGARVTLYQTPELRIEPAGQDRNEFRNMYDLVESVSKMGYYGGARLLKATIKKFYEYCDQQQIRLENKNFTIRYYSTIPRQVGLAGSSAIVTATIRALMQLYGIGIPLEDLPSLVLAVETEELSINAGLQDRVIQAYEGCVYMNFDKAIMDAENRGTYERLDPSLLPKLYIAYRTDLSKESGKMFTDIRARFEKGEAYVVRTLERIAEVAEEGKKALKEGDVEKLNRLINENFNLRSKIMTISESNQELVRTARRCGASAKFTGSGGSIIGIYEDDEMLTRLIIDLKKIRARVIKPYVV